MPRLFAIAVLVVCAAGLLGQSADNARDDRAILADLKKVGANLARDKENATEARKLLEQLKNHVATAEKLLEEFEKNHPKSKLLAEARSAALKVLDESPDEAVQEKTIKMARALREVAARGSDHAAQADLILLTAEVNQLTKDLQSAAELKKAWARDGENLHKRIEGYLKEYPHYKPAMDVLAEVAELADAADGTRTRKLIQNAAAENFPDHPLAKAARREAAVGKEFEFDFIPVGGKKPTGLRDLRGKVVVLDFWASWCGPCKKEFPGLKALYEKHARDGLEIVGVNLDDKEQALIDCVRQFGLSWPQASGNAASNLADKWGIEAIPAMFVIDRKGRLRSVDGRGKLEKLIPELLAEK
jgi:thiol-disulfide isomerase/thioredoxin